MYGFIAEANDRERRQPAAREQVQDPEQPVVRRRTAASASRSMPGTGTWASTRKTIRIPRTKRIRRRMSGARNALSSDSNTVLRVLVGLGSGLAGGARRCAALERLRPELTAPPPARQRLPGLPLPCSAAPRHGLGAPAFGCRWWHRELGGLRAAGCDRVGRLLGGVGSAAVGAASALFGSADSAASRPAAARLGPRRPWRLGASGLGGLAGAAAPRRASFAAAVGRAVGPRRRAPGASSGTSSTGHRATRGLDLAIGRSR